MRNITRAALAAAAALCLMAPAAHAGNVRGGVWVGGGPGWGWGPSWSVGWNRGWGPGWNGWGWNTGWGPGWGPGWGAAWGPGWGVWAPPVVVSVPVGPPAVWVSEPATFIERQPAAVAAPPAAASWWYWCEPAQAYYPYVRQCAADWVRVAPQTPR